jgi:hypothetical protein
MYTTSIIHIQQLLSQMVSTFEHVEAYKVEFSMWDHACEPTMQLYVACRFNNEHLSIHTQSQSVAGALQEVEAWYLGISGHRLAMAS